ncbi:MAG: transposase [Planctomycetaceae bacterium]
MPRANRRDVLAEGEIQVVHFVNRCVRRAFLCGKDPLTGVDYEHRREMIRQRLEFLAGIMGIEVLGYSVMSNHLHCVLRSRHDVVVTWSDKELAQKWWALCPARKQKDGSAAEPTEFEINAIKNDRQKLKDVRIRLSSISWFMRFLCEKVARESNKQDECTGRFWEGRFKAQVLADDAAILACMQYVDLNPVRAKLAKTPEASNFTSAQDRIADAKTADEVSTADARDNRMEHGERAGWLAPVALRPKPRPDIPPKQRSMRPSLVASLAASLSLERPEPSSHLCAITDP